ncbi:unnamed protein product [Lampetra planeri]
MVDKEQDSSLLHRAITLVKWAHVRPAWPLAPGGSSSRRCLEPVLALPIFRLTSPAGGAILPEEGTELGLLCTPEI